MIGYKIIKPKAVLLSSYRRRFNGIEGCDLETFARMRLNFHYHYITDFEQTEICFLLNGTVIEGFYIIYSISLKFNI